MSHRITLREELDRAIALGSPVRLIVDDGEVVGVVEAIDLDPAQPVPSDWPGYADAAIEIPVPVAKVLLAGTGGRIVESVDLRRIQRVQLPRSRRRQS
jgi:hypothetical protein